MISSANWTLARVRAKIRLFVERDDGYGQLRRHDGYLILPAMGAEFVGDCVLSTPEQKGWGGWVILTCFARSAAGFVWVGSRCIDPLWLRLRAENLRTSPRCEQNAGPSAAPLAMKPQEVPLRMTPFLKSIGLGPQSRARIHSG